MESIIRESWILWSAALASATTGQVLSISGDGVVRVAAGAVITFAGIAGAVYASTALGLQATGIAAGVLALTAGVVSVLALRVDSRRFGATCLAAASVALFAGFSSAMLRAAQVLF